MALLRGDLDVNEIALKNALGVERLALASEDKVESQTGAPVGFVGPHKLPGEKVRIIADESIRDAVNAVTGAGRRDWHVRRLRPAPRRERPGVGRLRPGARRRSLPALRQAARDRARHRGRAHLQARDEVLEGALLRVHRREGRDPSRRHGDLRHRRRAHDGLGRRAAPRRRRDRLAARARALRDRARVAEPDRRGDPDGGGRALRRARRRRPRGLLRRPRRAARREVQGRGPDRLPDPGQRRRPRLKDGNVEVVLRRDKSVRQVPVAEALEAVKTLRAELAGK